jgi:HSP20 family molecular chaperone IbpA
MHDKHKLGWFNFVSDFFQIMLPGGRDPVAVLSEAINGVDRPVVNRYTSSIDKHGLVIDVDLSGVKPQDVTLWVAGQVIIVKHMTCRGMATHRYTVSADYDTSTTEANMDAGRLRVRVSRARAVVPRRVAIEYVGRSDG